MTLPLANTPEVNRAIDRARRYARQHGLRVEKSRCYPNNRGGLMLIDIRNNNNVILDGWNYDLTPADIVYAIKIIEKYGYYAVLARLGKILD
jgi:hypothetical protein